MSLLRPLLKIDEREVEFARRGFVAAQPAVRQRLEHVGRMFLEGYHAALVLSAPRDQEELAARLDRVGVEHCGFAFEGAAMALALLDGITPWSNWKRFSSFAAGPGRQHIYMLHVGAGWAIARLPWLRRRFEVAIEKLHPVLGWLAIEGYGFHEGYFHWRAPLDPKISKLSEDARHVFYQGLGRSLWFVNGADVSLIAQTISTLAPKFHNDAWSGVGLGCGYAGGLNQDELQQLGRYAGVHRAALAQGAAFAAGARRLAGNPAAHTELACAVLCGMNAEQASALCDRMLEQASGTSGCAFRTWQRLLRTRFQSLGDRLQGTENRVRVGA